MNAWDSNHWTNTAKNLQACSILIYLGGQHGVNLLTRSCPSISFKSGGQNWIVGMALINLMALLPALCVLLIEFVAIYSMLL